MEFGILRHVEIREVWRNEALNFTPWLQQNISALGEALGLDLEVMEREAPVGGYSLDLLARDVGRERTVIIENQLEATDHSHLGQLITYAAGFDAGVVIWVVKSVREEHRQALDWLNQHTSETLEFYAVVVEVIRIDDSRPAYYFKPVVFPNDWQKSTMSTRAKSSPQTQREAQHQSFFQDVIDELRETHRFTNAKKAQPKNWYSFSSGIGSVTYGLNFSRSGLRAEVYIGTSSLTWNQAMFQVLLAQRDSLEQAFGGTLDWEPMEGKLACRIVAPCGGTIDDSQEELEHHKRRGIETLLKLRDVFGPALLNSKAAAERTLGEVNRADDREAAMNSIRHLPAPSLHDATTAMNEVH